MTVMNNSTKHSRSSIRCLNQHGILTVVGSAFFIAVSVWTSSPSCVDAFLTTSSMNHYATSTARSPRRGVTSSSVFVVESTNPSSIPNEITNTSTPCEMKLNEIKAELKKRSVSFVDCFDRESLEKRLLEARDCSDLPQSSSTSGQSINNVEDTAEQTSNEFTTEEATTLPPIDTAKAESVDFDRDAILVQLRSLRVKELKIKLSELKVRWGKMIEKEEMVSALCNAMEERYHQSKNFSRSGVLVPGIVADVDESVMLKELGWLESDVNRGMVTQRQETSSSSSSTSSSSSSSMGATSPHPPILLDVYATWCGPCKFLAPILEKVAEEVGPTVRVIKLDSDKYPRLSSVLKGEYYIHPSFRDSCCRHLFVCSRDAQLYSSSGPIIFCIVGGLPTLIRFDGGDVSKEIQRVEGALSKDQLIDFVSGNFRM